MDITTSKKYIYIRWLLLRLGLVIFDVLAVNAAYYLALVVRFYVNFEFNVWAVKYVPAFFEFAPYYTVCSLVVFWAMGLYKSLWKYAGLHDMNRIIGASIVTCVIHILGTLLFVMRMPITYYALGAAFQFVLLTVSRFSYRLLLIERGKFFRKRKKETVNVMVVGTGESSRMVLKHFDRDPDSIVRPVCVIDFSNSEFQGTMGGVQVIRGVENIASAVQKYQVDRVLLADTAMPEETSRKIRELCKEIDLNVQEFSEYFQNTPSRIPLHTIMEYAEGPLWIEIGGEKRQFEKPEEALAAVPGKYIVVSVGVHDGQLCIELIQDMLMPNDIKADWVRDYQKTTGEDISFF